MRVCSTAALSLGLDRQPVEISAGYCFEKSRGRISPPLKLSSVRVFMPNLLELGRKEVEMAEEGLETKPRQG